MCERITDFCISSILNATLRSQASVHMQEGLQNGQADRDIHKQVFTGSMLQGGFQCLLLFVTRCSNTL
jgi:hypothetical protein